MIGWLLNWQNWIKLGVAGIVVALNYLLGWGWDAQAIATLGGLFVIPVELWEFVTEQLRKFLRKE